MNGRARVRDIVAPPGCKSFFVSAVPGLAGSLRDHDYLSA
jgi:hypothetical protein